LNQNARDFGAANSPAMNKAVLRLCIEHDVGMVQIPCPEMTHLGLLRERKSGQSIRDALDTDAGRETCRDLSVHFVNKIQDYIKNNNRLLAILGGNPESPACAIHLSPGHLDQPSLTEKSGIFMQELSEQLSKHQIVVPFRAMRDCRPEWLQEDLLWLAQLFTHERIS
jgi:predicted secreted protein